MARQKLTHVCEGCGQTFQREAPRYCSRVCSGHGKRTHYLTRIAAYLKQFSDPEPCWIWIGQTNQSGYGRVTNSRQSVLAHRAAWEFMHGPIPAGMVVCHRCDNPPCINHTHLFLGTQSQNAKDMYRKGRSGVHGERNHWSVFTDADIREIRASTDTLQQLADRYGVHKPAIWRIIRRERWKHVV